MKKVRTPNVQVNVSVKAKGKARVNVTVNADREQAKATPRRPLRFGHGNAKLDSGIYTFSVPAGWTCPNAAACQSKANPETGRITDGPATEFRCYAASMEARHRSVRDSRWRNLYLLKGLDKEGMTNLILDSFSQFAGYVRIHDSGDFFSQDYFDAWVEVARRRLRTMFYAYTKALPFWVKRQGEIPTNFVLTASYGGTRDELIEEHQLRYAKVVYSQAEADRLGLEIDHDDSHAMKPGPSFALLIHGTQPGGTPAAKALAALRVQGEFGYGEKADKRRSLPLVGTT